MAKRFTDTGKWDKAWFRALKPRLKCLWQYIFDRCDLAGFWDEDYTTAAFFVGERVSFADIEAVFLEKVIRIAPDKLFFPGFIPFQYGELKAESKAHLGVLRSLEKNGILYPSLTPSIPFHNGTGVGVGVGVGKREGGMGETKTSSPLFDFGALYQKYPRKEGKSAGLLQCKKQIHTEADYGRLSQAIDRYSNHCQKTEQIIKHFSSFLGSDRTGHPWQDWCDLNAGMGSKIDTATGEKVREREITERIKREEEEARKGMAS